MAGQNRNRPPAGYMVVSGGYYNPRTKHRIAVSRQSPQKPYAQQVAAIPAFPANKLAEFYDRAEAL